MRCKTRKSALPRWRGVALATGVSALFLAALSSWISWTGFAGLAGVLLAGFGLGLPSRRTPAGSMNQTRALLRLVDQNLGQANRETERAIALTRDAAAEISRCFVNWDKSISNGNPASSLEAARTTSCEIVRLLQFEDISSQALNTSLKEVAECRNAIQSLEQGDADIADIEKRLLDWQAQRRTDAQCDMRAGAVDLF